MSHGSPIPPAANASACNSEGAAFGRLERASAAAPMSEINMTPLIDVMLVLLVIFIITAPLMVSAVHVDLPKSATTSAAQAPKFVTVSISPKGELFAGEVPQTPEQLAALLKDAAKTNPDTELRLRADTGVAYGRVVEVMGLAQKAGLSRIGFIADTAVGATP